MRGFYATTALAMLLGCSAVTASGQEMTAQSRAEAAGDAWAATTEAQMTDAERFSLLHGFMPIPIGPYARSEEHTSELQSLMRISYAVFCLKKKKNKKHQT